MVRRSGVPCKKQICSLKTMHFYSNFGLLLSDVGLTRRTHCCWAKFPQLQSLRYWTIFNIQSIYASTVLSIFPCLGINKRLCSIHLCKSGQKPCQSRVQVNISYCFCSVATRYLIGINSVCKLTAGIKYNFSLPKCHKIEVQETLV